MNRLDGTPGTAEIVSEVWNKLTDGHVNYEPVYEKDYFKDLANYIVKEPTEEITGQLTLFGEEEETKIFIKYDCSRNLEMPEKKTHKYKRRTVRKLIEMARNHNRVITQTGTASGTEKTRTPACRTTTIQRSGGTGCRGDKKGV